MNFPKPEIDRETAMQLWISEHSDYAKEQLVLNNQGIIGMVLNSLNLNPLDEDLYATGLVGIVKAVNNYRSDTGIRFSTYAAKVVRNEILMLLRKKRITPAFSLDESRDFENGEKMFYADMIADKRCFEDETIADMQFDKIFDSLSERDRKIVSLRMDGKVQSEIAEACGVSQAQVSRVIKEFGKKLVKTED